MPHPATPVSRSSVVRGLAWSVPAVAAVAAAPFAAASPARYTLNFSTGVAATGVPDAPTARVGVTSTSPGGLARTTSQLTVNGVQTVTIDFGREVSDVTFTLADIDWYDNNGATGVREVVAVTPSPSRTAPVGVTATSPFSTVTVDTTGFVDVTIAGPLRSITIQLSNTGRGKATPDVLVQNLSFITDLARAA